jgi:hypothetical protein
VPDSENACNDAPTLNWVKAGGIAASTMANRSRSGWTPQLVKALRRHIKRGRLSASGIAKAMESAYPGQRISRGMVISKAHQLGLAVRPEHHWGHPKFAKREGSLPAPPIPGQSGESFDSPGQRENGLSARGR